MDELDLNAEEKSKFLTVNEQMLKLMSKYSMTFNSLMKYFHACSGDLVLLVQFCKIKEEKPSEIKDFMSMNMWSDLDDEVLNEIFKEYLVPTNQILNQ